MPRLDVTRYWMEPPPEPTPALAKWMAKIKAGWRPNIRIRRMGYHSRAEFFGVYIWEYYHVIYPALKGVEP